MKQYEVSGHITNMVYDVSGKTIQHAADPRAEYEYAAPKVVGPGPGRKGAKTVELAPDVAEAFPTAEAVNEALRFLIRADKKF